MPTTTTATKTSSVAHFENEKKRDSPSKHVTHKKVPNPTINCPPIEFRDFFFFNSDSLFKCGEQRGLTFFPRLEGVTRAWCCAETTRNSKFKLLLSIYRRSLNIFLFCHSVVSPGKNDLVASWLLKTINLKRLMINSCCWCHLGSTPHHTHTHTHTSISVSKTWSRTYLRRSNASSQGSGVDSRRNPIFFVIN